MKKRVIATIIVLCMVLALFPFSVSAAYSGNCGERLTWVLKNDTLTISGTGDMKNYTSATDTPWCVYSGIINIVVEEGVTGIGSYAFYGLREVQQVSLPDSVTRIGMCAFNKCDSLLNVDIPAQVTVIEEYAFASCSSLEEIYIPEGIVEIKDGAFSWCASLINLELPESLREIGDDTFRGCKKLTDITIPNSVTRIGEEAFDSCEKLERVVLSSGLTDIEYGVFKDCVSIQQMVIPDNIQIIGQYAFSNCQKLKTFIIPKKMTIIGNWAFNRCSRLEEIHFTGDAPFIEKYAFMDVTASAFYPCENETWTQEILLNYGGKITWISDGESDINSNPFVDVPEDSFYIDPVLWAVENGITNGTSETTFSPSGQCQRAAVVTFLWRAAGSPEPVSTTNPFTDVKESDFYYKAVLWAVEKGITNGLTAKQFGPYALCNRAQVVTFLWRAQGQPKPATTENPFIDVIVTEWYGPAVLWAVENGITNGMGDGTFGVGSICNRAQVVTFLYRAMA